MEARTWHDVGLVTAAPPRTRARIVGVLNLLVIVGGFFAEGVVLGRVVVRGDAAATAANIVAHEALYRAGIAVELFFLLASVPIALLLYDLFHVVERRAAVVMLIFGLLAPAIEGVGVLTQYAPLLWLGKGAAASPFTTAQLAAAAWLSIRIFESGFLIALGFFGSFCVALGWLVFRSDFVPRVIGALVLVQGVLYLADSFLSIGAPTIGARVGPLLAVSELGGEVSLCVWLLIMGVNAARWQHQAARSSASMYEATAAEST
jgi:Domain of unknown function (DUF4386)